MSTKKDSKAYLLEVYRRNTTRTLNDVRRGLVNEEDLDKLQNFIQTSLALMDLVSLPVFRQAERNAELLGFLKGNPIILDPKKVPKLDMDSIVQQAQQQMEISNE